MIGENYIRTFLERDIPQLGFDIPAEALRRCWAMLAHSNTQVINQSILAKSLGVSSLTIKSYLDILEGDLVVRKLIPYYTNTKKRLVKSPKIYIRDSGLTHCLLNIETMNELLGQPVIGSTFESVVIDSAIAKFPRHEAFSIGPLLV